MKRFGYILCALLLVSSLAGCLSSGDPAAQAPESAADTASASSDVDTVSSATTSEEEEKTEESQPAPPSSEEFIPPELVPQTFSINGHEYQVDTVSSATKEIPVDKDTPSMTYEEKMEKMHWSGRPAPGAVQGELYHKEMMFGSGYIAVIDVVKDQDKIVMVEFDEIGPQNYYTRKWAGQPKRLSGYGFFQAQNQRTDVSLASLINTMTYLEWQMVGENRLTGDFNTVKGSSNSARNGFLPVAEAVAAEMDTPSGQHYYGITQDLGDGMSARLVVIESNDRISYVKYDEYFADTQDEITDPGLKAFYRQSKYYSVDYTGVTGKDFKNYSCDLTAAVIASQDLLQLTPEVEGNAAFAQELSHYKALADEMTQLISK